jgi:hypothetical protein
MHVKQLLHLHHARLLCHCHNEVRVASTSVEGALLIDGLLAYRAPWQPVWSLGWDVLQLVSCLINSAAISAAEGTEVCACS